MPRRAPPPPCFRGPPPAGTSALTGAGYLLDKRHHIVDRVLEDRAVVYLLEGGGQYADDCGRRVAVQPGDLLILTPGPRHGYGPGPGQVWSECFLMYRGPLFDALEAEGIPPADTVLLRPGRDPRLMASFDDLIRAFATASPRDSRWLATQVPALLAWALRCHGDRVALPGEQGLVEATCALLEEHLAAPIDLARVARRLDTTYDHLRKVFARHTGQSLTRYRLQRRIERAQALLVAGQSIEDVARDLGYGDRAFFTRQFTRLAGQAPGQWLRAHSA